MLNRVDTGIVLQLPCSDLMAFMCFENELRWSAAAVRPQDQRTCAEVLSPRGVQALAPLAAIQFTGLVLIDMVSAQYFSPDFLMVLLTGNGRGVYHSGWHPALMTYSTAMLVACGIGLWRGVEHPLVAPRRLFRTIECHNHKQNLNSPDQHKVERDTKQRLRLQLDLLRPRHGLIRPENCTLHMRPTFFRIREVALYSSVCKTKLFGSQICTPNIRPGFSALPGLALNRVHDGHDEPSFVTSC